MRAALLLLLATPIAAQAQTPVPATAAESVDPALLAKAQPIAATILPNGTMEKMMGPMMQKMMPEMIQAMPEIMKSSAAELAKLPKPRTYNDLTKAERERLTALLGADSRKAN